MKSGGPLSVFFSHTSILSIRSVTTETEKGHAQTHTHTLRKMTVTELRHPPWVIKEYLRLLRPQNNRQLQTHCNKTTLARKFELE